MLLQASEIAYGVTDMAEVADSAVRMSRLARVCAEGLEDAEDCTRIALRWEAIASDGKPFAILDADLMLIPAGDENTILALTGGYRPQPGQAGADLDETILGRHAAATIRTFLGRIASALVHPAGAAGPKRRNSPR
jgi:hypothetical protein